MIRLTSLIFSFRWITEIKIIALLVIAHSTPEIEGGKYVVVDPMNVTSVPPVGQLLLHALKLGQGSASRYSMD